VKTAIAFPKREKFVPALLSIKEGFLIGAIAFQKSRTADINHDINAPTKIYICECGAFVWLNLAQQEHFTTCSATFSQS
jgi:hypothetical protein